MLTGFLHVNKKKMKQEWRLEKLVDLKQRNLYAGDTHIHRKLETVPLLMMASDLNVGELFTSWNDPIPSG